ncbi:hypothetical protein [Lysinibacillus sp. FSL P2-0066]|mgnify:CR=1 FL=1|uniref:hypothetical protein n=1 Tax=unclassified Lysinibacillus TaxID=2636778 RepID=UPI0030D8C216
MVTTEEVAIISEPNIRKDVFEWEHNGTTYRILNVPFEVHEEFEEDLLDMSVSITLSNLRDLMVTGEIPETVLDYDKFANVL